MILREARDTMSKEKRKTRKAGGGKSPAKPAGEPAAAAPGERIPRPWRIVIAAALVVAALCVLYPELVFRNQVFLSGDVEAAASFATPIQKEMAETGGYPLWNPYLFSGMPSYGSLSYNPYVYPVSIVTGFLTDALGFPNATWLLFHAFLLGFGVFLLLWDRGVHFAAAAAAGILMMWAPHHVAVGAHGHGSQANAIAYIPFALFFWDRIWRGKHLAINAAALVVVLGFQLLRAHIQISYYTFALLGMHTLFFGAARIRSARRGTADPLYPNVLGIFGRALRRREVAPRRVAVLETADLVVIFGVVALLALMVSAVLFMPVQDYSQYSIRGASESGGLDYDYATSWSLHPLEGVTFLVPFSFGFGNILYHGRMPFTDYPNYIGLVVFVFAVIAALFARSRFVWFLLLVIGVTTLVSFGKYFPLLYNPLFKWMPYFNKFRVPVMVLIVQQFAFVLLFGIGLSAVPANRDHPLLKRFARWGLIAGGVLLILCLASSSYWTEGFARKVAGNIKAVRTAPEQLQLARLGGAFLFKDLVKASVLLLAVFGVLAFYAGRKLSGGVLMAVVGLAAAADMYLVDRYVLHPERLYPRSLGADEQVSIIKPKTVRDRFLEPDALIEFLRSNAATDSVAGLATGGESAALYRVFPAFHPSAPLAGGDFATNRFMNFGISSVGGYHAAKLAVYADFIEILDAALQRSNYHLLNVMNARYAVTSHPFPDVPSFERVWEGTDYQGRRRYVYANTQALPRLFFVDRYAALDAEEITALLPTLPSSGIDLSETVLLEKEPPIRPVSKAGARAAITRFSLNEIRVDASLASPAILVLSEVFYPKWKVTVDGEEGEILKADYVLRAVALGAGEHEIVFRFDDAALSKGLWISAATLSAVLIVLIVSSVFVLRGKPSWKP